MVKLSYTQIRYSSKDFVQLINKRVRKTIRESSFKPSQKVFLLDDGSKEFIVGKVILEKIFPHLAFISKKRKRKGLLVFRNLEQEINLKFEFFIKNKKIPKNDYFNPLASILEEEIVAYGKCLGIKIPKTVTKINPMISVLQKKYSETKFSLGKSLKVLERKSI